MQTVEPTRHLVMAMGAFDGVHLGHQALIRQVIEIAERDNLTPGIVTFEPHPQLILHPECTSFKLITIAQEKELLLHRMGIQKVAVIPFTSALSQMNAEAFLSEYLDHQLQIHTLVVGFDHHFGHDKELTFDDYHAMASRYGIRCVRGDAYSLSDQASSEPVSSTAIRRWIDTGAITEAERQLGHPYTILGCVQGGLQLGRTLGYPTANITIPSPYKALPPAGVYMARTTIDPQDSLRGDIEQRDIPSMLYIGTRPTLELSRPELTIEVFLMGGANYQLYGQELQIALCNRLRQELHFENLEALRKQITRDEEAVRRYFHLSD